MGKYYKGIVLLLCLLFASSAYAVSPAILQGMSSGEANQELGATSIVNYDTGWYDFCVLQPSQTTGVMTVRYGYIYATTGTADNNFRMAVYENSGGVLGSQLGGCSDDGLITTDAAAWNQTTWSSDFPVIQPATTYWICFWNDASATYYNEDNSGGTSSWDFGTGTCTDEPPNYDGTTYTNIVVSNYDAY